MPHPLRDEERVAAQYDRNVVVPARKGATLDPDVIRRYVAGEIARFKAPRAVAVCQTVQRHANGKPDYRWAETVAATAQLVAGGDH